MDNSIICPACKKPIPLNEALSHQVKDQLESEREKMRTTAREWKEEQEKKMQKMQDEQLKKLEEEKTKLQEETMIKVKEQVKREMELKLKDTQNESEELSKQNKQLQEQLLDLTKSMRQQKQEIDAQRLEDQKKLDEEIEKIKIGEKQRTEDEYRLKMAEKDKKINDALQMVEDYKRKIEQGSQQSQGEILELEVENLLRQNFPFDDIKEVAKGRVGADAMQVVRNNQGIQCGVILWELKRTKSWDNKWIQKLKDDQREVKAELAVIITEVLPPDIKFFGQKDGIWVGSFNAIIGMGTLLRKTLLDVMLVKAAQTGQKGKMEIMWEYLNSTEFDQKMQAIFETFKSMQDDIDKEKIWFRRKWERQEANIRRVIDNTAGMQGSLESIMGKSLPEVPGFDFAEEEVPKLPEKKKVKEIDGEAETLF